MLLRATIALAGSNDAGPFWGWQARVGIVLAIWLVVGPVIETGCGRPRPGSARRGP